VIPRVVDTERLAEVPDHQIERPDHVVPVIALDGERPAIPRHDEGAVRDGLRDRMRGRSNGHRRDE